MSKNFNPNNDDRGGLGRSGNEWLYVMAENGLVTHDNNENEVYIKYNKVSNKWVMYVPGQEQNILTIEEIKSSIKLDEFQAATDNMNLDATELAHGLMPKAMVLKLNGIESNATGDMAAGEIVSLYHSLIPVATVPEMEAGTQTLERNVSPYLVRRAVEQFASESNSMLKSVYDSNDNGIVDNSEKLNSQFPSYYLNIANQSGTLNRNTTTQLLRNNATGNTGNLSIEIDFFTTTPTSQTYTFNYAYTETPVVVALAYTENAVNEFFVTSRNAGTTSVKIVALNTSRVAQTSETMLIIVGRR